MSDGNDHYSYVSYRIGPDQDKFSGKKRKVGIRFDKDEIKELGIALLVITLAFAVVLSNGSILNRQFDLLRFLEIVPFALIATLTGFLVHEIAHKVIANHYGYPAAFSYNKKYLIFGAVASILLGFLFAAPGAVYIYGRPNKKENGIISAGGPLTNLIIGYLCLGMVVPFTFITGVFGMGIFYIGLINLFIGAFNMLPIKPLDGSKVWRWSKIVYLIMAVLIITPILLFYFAIMT